MKSLHEFGDRGGKIPPMDVEEVNVVGLQLPEARIERDFQALCVVALEIGLDTGLGSWNEAGSKFGGDDHFVAIFVLGHPFSDPGFALFVLVVVGRVNEVTAVIIEEIEHGEGGLLVTFAH